MNALVERVVAVCAAAVLTSAATAAPAAAMDAVYTCTSGTRFLVSDLLGYYIVASGCTGSGSGTWGTVTIPSGSYFCQNVVYDSTIDYVNGHRC